MTKREELGRLDSTINRCQDEEPVFLLAGHDVLAPGRVDDWCNHAEVANVNPKKVARARQIAEDMRAWQATHGSKIPDYVDGEP